MGRRRSGAHVRTATSTATGHLIHTNHTHHVHACYTPSTSRSATSLTPCRSMSTGQELLVRLYDHRNVSRTICHNRSSATMPISGQASSGAQEAPPEPGLMCRMLGSCVLPPRVPYESLNSCVVEHELSSTLEGRQSLPKNTD